MTQTRLLKIPIRTLDEAAQRIAAGELGRPFAAISRRWLNLVYSVLSDVSNQSRIMPVTQSNHKCAPPE
jgi:hypothetical protein